jgi:phage shock protein A
MGLFSRISDIISANFNDMAEQFEDPEKMLKQAIREMEETINESTQQTAKAMANEKTLTKELLRNEQQVARWQDNAVTAITAGDDGLATKALERKQEHEKLVVALADQAAAASEACTALRHQLEAMRAKLAEAKRSLATLVARQRAADFRKKMDSSSPGAGSDPSAFAKFDRLKSRVEQAEAEAAALSELRAAENELSADCPPENLEVAAELAELKRKLGAG